MERHMNPQPKPLLEIETQPFRLNRGVVELIADNDYPPRTDPARTEKGGLNDYNEDRP